MGFFFLNKTNIPYKINFCLKFKDYTKTKFN